MRRCNFHRLQCQPRIEFYIYLNKNPLILNLESGDFFILTRSVSVQSTVNRHHWIQVLEWLLEQVLQSESVMLWGSA